MNERGRPGERAAGRPIMSSLHGFWSVGIPRVVGARVRPGGGRVSASCSTWSWRPAFSASWALWPRSGCCAASGPRRPGDRDEAGSVDGGRPRRDRLLRLPRGGAQRTGAASTCRRTRVQAAVSRPSRLRPLRSEWFCPASAATGWPPGSARRRRSRRWSRRRPRTARCRGGVEAPAVLIAFALLGLGLAPVVPVIFSAAGNVGSGSPALGWVVTMSYVGAVARAGDDRVQSRMGSGSGRDS